MASMLPTWPLRVHATPWPILLERIVSDIRDGRFEDMMCSADQLVRLRGKDFRIFASKSVVLERLHLLQQVCLGEQVSLVTGSLESSRSLKARHDLLDLFGRLPSPIQGHLLSPAYDHSVSFQAICTQLETIAEQAQPRRDVSNALPDEIFVLIGHYVLETTLRKTWPLKMKWCKRDQDRFALTAVCRRWRTVFSMGEFWRDLTLDSGRRHKTRAGRWVAQVESHLSRGHLRALNIPYDQDPDILLPILRTMTGRSAMLKTLGVAIPDTLDLEVLWDVWSDLDDFHLERLSIGYGGWEFKMSPGLDVSSLVDLEFTQATVNLVTIAEGLPHLQELEMTDCELVDPNGTLQHPKTIRFPSLRTLIYHGDETDSGVWGEPGTVFLDLPSLVKLKAIELLRALNDDGHSDFLYALLRPPHARYSRLANLQVTPIKGRGTLLTFLSRHPTIAKLALFGCESDLTSTTAASHAAVIEALGRDCCPALRILRLETCEKAPPDPSALIAMIRAREESAAKGEEITPIHELHIRDDGGEEDDYFSDEEVEWLSEHLQGGLHGLRQYI